MQRFAGMSIVDGERREGSRMMSDFIARANGSSQEYYDYV